MSDWLPPWLPAHCIDSGPCRPSQSAGYIIILIWWLPSHGRLDAACLSAARAVYTKEEDLLPSNCIGSISHRHFTISRFPQDWPLPELPSSVSFAELLPSAGNVYTDLGSLQRRLAAVATVALRLQLRMRRVPSPGATSTPRVVVTRYSAALLPALYLFLA